MPALVNHFIRHFNARFNRGVKGIAADAMAALMAYDFPGNVRELENLVERAFALGAHDEIRLEDLPALSVRGAAARVTVTDGPLPSLNAARTQVERELILRALQLYGNDREQAARALSISSRTLYRRLRAHRLL
jgi:transcriptional regulator with PAS, ATPase and Fis domain